MAYSELIKDFNRIRAYLRSFYVYGFRHRSEFDQKSARGYDNERRRVESWLGQYMSFGQDEDGRRTFLSVDSRAIPENPLYRAFRTKTFTDLDITLHFLLLDILPAEEGLPMSEIMRKLVDRLYEFDSFDLPDESTVRKKLKEYTELGIVRTEKQGREIRYKRSDDPLDLTTWDAACAFFSETAPLGVIGAYVQDHLPARSPFFRFKHHYILNALDSEVVYELLKAIGEKRYVTFTSHRQRVTVLPLRIFIGTQTGKQYLLALNHSRQRFSFYRVDMMDNIRAGEAADPEDLKRNPDDFLAHSWGVTVDNDDCPEHIEMTIRAGNGEEHIVRRLEREKRCGTVEQLDETHWRFSADIYNTFEILPWLRTFIGRITDLQCTDPVMLERFWKDFDRLADFYGGNNDALP